MDFYPSDCKQMQNHHATPDEILGRVAGSLLLPQVWQASAQVIL